MPRSKTTTWEFALDFGDERQVIAQTDIISAIEHSRAVAAYRPDEDPDMYSHTLVGRQVTTVTEAGDWATVDTTRALHALEDVAAELGIDLSNEDPRASTSA